MKCVSICRAGSVRAFPVELRKLIAKSHICVYIKQFYCTVQISFVYIYIYKRITATCVYRKIQKARHDESAPKITRRKNVIGHENRQKNKQLIEINLQLGNRLIFSSRDRGGKHSRTIFFEGTYHTQREECAREREGERKRFEERNMLILFQLLTRGIT